jgi:hypothetical protein
LEVCLKEEETANQMGFCNWYDKKERTEKGRKRELRKEGESRIEG